MQHGLTEEKLREVIELLSTEKSIVHVDPSNQSSKLVTEREKRRF